MERICFENIFMEVLRPFKVCLSSLLVRQTGGTDIRAHIRDIDFRHIRGRAELTSEILGNQTGEISGLRFTDVRLDYYGRGPAPYLDEQNVWERESTASAFLFREVKSALVERLRIHWCADPDRWLHEAELENSQVEFNECELKKGTISK